MGGDRGRAGWVVIGFAAYFGLALVPEWWPRFGQNWPFHLYALSCWVAAFGLSALAVWGGVRVSRARRRRSMLRPFDRWALWISLPGLLLFGVSTFLGSFLRAGLPSGSHSLHYDRATWLDSTASEFIRGDITARQKMLGDVVEHVLPNRDRAEIEQLLGPSMTTSYFEGTGRDLIYLLGPERGLFGIDSEWLLVWLDDRGRFLRFALVTD